MKDTGIERKVDEMGRFVLPKETRMTLGIEDNTPLRVFVDDDMIMLKKVTPNCIICGSTTMLREYKGKNLCNACCQDIFLSL